MYIFFFDFQFNLRHDQKSGFTGFWADLLGG